MAGINDSVTQNLLPVQAYFDLQGNFQTFIGQNQPFYATTNPAQSGLTITSSTIDSTTIGASSPSTGVFTNITTTTGQVLTSPSGNTDITNKLYVDTVAQGLGPKQACQVGTTTNITLVGLQTIDGYTTLDGDRVLVKNQTLSQFNGIYIASTTTWTRAVDLDVWSEVPGAYTVILNGGQADQGWVCTATAAGTINVTAMPWVQFSGSATYYAGTGLSLSSNTFSITNTGVTALTYGSASAVPVIAVNAQGQITSATTTTIAITNSQVSGLGTMSTQNANSVAITGGSINGTTIGVSTAAAITGTTITANTSFSGSGSGLTGTATGLSIGGNAATATSATSAGSVTNSVTFNNGGSGGASGSTFNGASALTVSYNTVGAPSTTGTNASGTWGISVTGNAATVTNGVYTTGSYSNPAWITSILGSIVSGAVTSATTATNIASGTTGALHYQSGPGATTFLTLGTTNYVLTAGASAPQYVAQSTLSVGSASTATSATTATNLAGGIASQIPYQTGAGATSFIANGISGQFLTSNGSGVPSWATVSTAITITDDTSSVTAYYPLFARVTSGTTNTEYVSSTKLNYTPSTGVLAATGFSGSGASLTSIPNGALVNSSVTIGSTAVALGATVTTFAGLTSVTSTSFVGALTGNASTATSATTATNATNTAITDNTSSSATWYPTIVSTTTGNLPQTTSSTKLSFVPSTGTLTTSALISSGGTIDNTVIGGTTPAAGTFNTLIGGRSSTTYVTITGDASYPMIQATGGTNTPLVLSPLGTGALQAQKTDSSATGGNARGANAVDWQTVRSTAAQVASGAVVPTIAGGQNNTASAAYTFIGGGRSNTAGSNDTVVCGGASNTAGGSTPVRSAIVGGNGNIAQGYYNFIGAGYINTGTSQTAVTTNTTTIALTAQTTVYLSSTNANIKVGQYIIGTGVTADTYATSTVTTGTAAVMNTSTISGTTLTVGSLASGTIIAGMVLTGTGVTAGTYIVSGSGSSWTVSTSQSVSSTTITGTAYTFTISQAATTAAGVTLSFYTPHGVVVGGGNNQATGAYSFIGGGGDAGTAANRNTASGDWSFVGGGQQNTASGSGSVVAGGGAGSTSGIGISGNQATGTVCTVGGGIGNSASGVGSTIIGGRNNQSNANYSVVVGSGWGTTRGIQGNTVLPAGTAPLGATQGLAQTALLVLGKQTTDATATVITSDGSTAGSTNQVILPNNSAYYFKARVISGVTGAGNTKAWTLEGAIKRGAGVGTTAIVGTVTTTVVAADAGASTWTVTATADTSNGGLAITFTGQAGTTIRTVCKVETAEMTF